MNFYTLAAKMNRQINKTVHQQDLLHRSLGIEKTNTELYDMAQEQAIKEFRNNAKLGIQLMLEFKTIATDMGLYADKLKQTYFITIRPNENDITFSDFFTLVHKFVSRKCFKTFTLVFEQKAIEPPYGKGFHCHIQANMTQRSKTEVLRDTQSTFKHCASANCIQVDIIKTPDDAARNLSYILEWQSADGHKEVTKNADIAWREQLGLLPSYTEPMQGSSARQLSSPVLAGSENIPHSGPIIIDMS